MKTVANTGGVPAWELLDRWRQLVESGFAPMDISTDRPDRFHAEQHVVPLGGVQVWDAGCSRSQACRTRPPYGGPTPRRSAWWSR